MIENEILEHIEELLNQGFSEDEIKSLFAMDDGLKEALVTIKNKSSIKPGHSLDKTKPPTEKMKPAIDTLNKNKKVVKAGEGLKESDGTEANADYIHKSPDVDLNHSHDDQESDFIHWYHETVIGGKWQFPSIQDAMASYKNWCTLKGKDCTNSEESFKQHLQTFNSSLIHNMEKPKMESMSAYEKDLYWVTLAKLQRNQPKPKPITENKPTPVVYKKTPWENAIEDSNVLKALTQSFHIVEKKKEEPKTDSAKLSEEELNFIKELNKQ